MPSRSASIHFHEISFELIFIIDFSLFCSLKADPNPLTCDLSDENVYKTCDKTPRSYHKILLRSIVTEEIPELDDSPKFDENLDIYSGAVPENRLKNMIYPNVVFLGTGSATGNYHRGSAAVLVNIS